MSKRDWKNSEEYKYLDNAENEQWAWEFLRRSESYRKDYEKYLDYPTIDDLDDFKDRPDFGEYYIGDPEIHANESYDEYLERCRGSKSTCIIDSIISDITEKYCLEGEGLPDPDSSDLPKLYYPNLIYFDPDLDFGEKHVVRMLRRKPVDESHHIACYFNLSYPLKDQMDEAYERLSKLQDYMVEEEKLDVPGDRATQPKYPRYIRLLDALKDNATERVILDTLYAENINAGRSNLTRNKKAARELVEGKYKILLYKK